MICLRPRKFFGEMSRLKTSYIAYDYIEMADVLFHHRGDQSRSILA